MKKVKISDVAKQAGVSNATVSRALNQKSLVNQETYSKIIEAMNLLGYRPVENVARFSTITTSRLILVDIPTFNNPFYSKIIFGIETIANKNNYQVIINSTGFQNIISLCKDIKVGGIITLSGYSAAQLDQLIDLAPIVQCCEYCEDYPLPYVSIDDYESTKKALSHLYVTGKKKFSLINHSSDYKFARERKRAFKDFLNEYGLEYNQSFDIALPEFDYSLAVSAIKFMLSQKDRPDAIFTTSDVFATAAIKAAATLNINVPNELSIIGFDNLAIDEMIAPSITSVKQPRFIIGSTACEFLLEKIRHPEIPNKQYLLDTELIIRDSTLK